LKIENVKSYSELRGYLESLDLEDTAALEQRAEEIIENVTRCMAFYLELPKGDQLRTYFEPRVREIKRTYEQRDFSPLGFPLAIRGLISYIQWK